MVDFPDKWMTTAEADTHFGLSPGTTERAARGILLAGARKDNGEYVVNLLGYRNYIIEMIDLGNRLALSPTQKRKGTLKEYYSGNEAANMLGISYKELDELLKKKILIGQKSGRGWRIWPADLERYRAKIKSKPEEQETPVQDPPVPPLPEGSDTHVTKEGAPPGPIKTPDEPEERMIVHRTVPVDIFFPANRSPEVIPPRKIPAAVNDENLPFIRIVSRERKGIMAVSIDDFAKAIIPVKRETISQYMERGLIEAVDKVVTEKGTTYFFTEEDISAYFKKYKKMKVKFIKPEEEQ